MRTLIAMSVMFLLAAAAPTQAAIIIYGAHSDYDPIPGSSLSDVQMTVDLWVSDGVAVMSFRNTSGGAETTAVFKEIVLDVLRRKHS